MERLTLLFIVVFSFFSCISNSDKKNVDYQNVPSIIIDTGHGSVTSIIIDVGHGGDDNGAVVTHRIADKLITFREKDMSLRIAKALAACLSEKLPETEIVLTRTEDVLISKEERVIKSIQAAINNSRVIFVSIHLNYNSNRNISGFEVYYYLPPLLDTDDYINDPYLEDTIRNNSSLAQYILTAIGDIPELKDLSRSIKTDDYFVLKNAVCPSVLIECGYLSNKDEALLLNTDSYIEKLVEGIALGIEYFINADND